MKPILYGIFCASWLAINANALQVEANAASLEQAAMQTPEVKTPPPSSAAPFPALDNSIEILVNKLLQMKATVKDQWETTQEFEKRKANALVEVSGERTFAVRILEPRYDADSSTLSFMLRLGPTSQSEKEQRAAVPKSSPLKIKGDLRIIALMVNAISGNSYEAQNAYGAATTVTVTASTVFGLLVDSALPALQGNVKRGVLTTSLGTDGPMFSLQLDRDKAKEVMDSLQFSITGSVLDPAVKTYVIGAAPTLSMPDSTSIRMNLVRFGVESLKIIDGKNNVVLASYPR